MISILVPGYRGYIKDMFASLEAQTYRDFEVLVIWTGQAEKGFSMNEKLMEMTKIARGEYILVLCEDDMLDPQYLEKVMQHIEGNDIVYTDMLTFGDYCTRINAQPYCLDTFKSTTSPFITSLVRRSVWIEMNGFNPLQDFSDWDFWFRCFKAGKKAYHLKEPLFLYRKHNDKGSLDMEGAFNKVKKDHPEVIVPRRFLLNRVLRKLRIMFRL